MISRTLPVACCCPRRTSVQWACGNLFSKHIACSYCCQMTALQECICIYLQRPNVLHGGNIPGRSQCSVGNAAVETRARGTAGDHLCRGWRTPYIAFVSRDPVPRSRCGEQPSHPRCSVFLGSGRATPVLLFTTPRVRNSPLALQSLCGACALPTTPSPTLQRLLQS